MSKEKAVVKMTRKHYYGLLVLTGILFFVGNFVTHIVTKRAFSLEQLRVLPLLNPARAFIQPKDLIIDVQPLREELTSIGEKDPRVSIYFEFLNTGANISVNKDADYWPASLLKLPVAMAVTKKIERGEWEWENELVVMTSDKDSRFGELYKQPIGTKLTLKKLVEEALQKSDNTANFMLVRNLEPTEFQDIYNHLGLEDFMSEEGRISAKKYSVIFRSLYNASYLSESDSQKLLEILSRTPFDEYAGSAIPDEVKFAHKIGVSDERNAFLDAGIVYVPKRPYILTIMIATNDNEEAKKIMYDISDRVYKYVVGY
jgi:beta-lactamase class A